MSRRKTTVVSDELYAIPVDEFIRGCISREGASRVADYDYDGDCGDDEDLSDMTPEAVIGCGSLIVNDATLLNNDVAYDTAHRRRHQVTPA